MVDRCQDSGINGRGPVQSSSKRSIEDKEDKVGIYSTQQGLHTHTNNARGTKPFIGPF